jgi:hypothetical protein
MSVMIDSGPPRKITWLTREQWARRRSTPWLIYINVSKRLCVYATSEEIAELQSALESRWREAGRAMYALKKAHPLVSAKDRPFRYLFAMSDADRDAQVENNHLRWERTAIRRLRHCLNTTDNVPADDRHARKYADNLTGRARKLYEAIETRWEEARREASDRALAEHRANNPIDDAAWAQELERRAAYERAHPERFESWKESTT